VCSSNVLTLFFTFDLRKVRATKKQRPGSSTVGALPSAAPGRKLADGEAAMSSLPPKHPKPQLPKVGFRSRADGTLETLDGAELELVESWASNYCHASGADARRLYGDLAELI
jgi:hypothetical protein